MYLIEQSDFIPTKTQRISKIDDTWPELVVNHSSYNRKVAVNLLFEEKKTENQKDTVLRHPGNSKPKGKA